MAAEREVRSRSVGCDLEHLLIGLSQTFVRFKPTTCLTPKRPAPIAKAQSSLTELEAPFLRTYLDDPLYWLAR